MNSYLHIHPNDNVFVALDILPAGTRVQGDGYDVKIGRASCRERV